VDEQFELLQELLPFFLGLEFFPGFDGLYTDFDELIDSLLFLELLVDQHPGDIPLLRRNRRTIGQINLHINNKILCLGLKLANNLILLNLPTHDHQLRTDPQHPQQLLGTNMIGYNIDRLRPVIANGRDRLRSQAQSQSAAVQLFELPEFAAVEDEVRVFAEVGLAVAAVAVEAQLYGLRASVAVHEEEVVLGRVETEALAAPWFRF
jgi:hypothetical protein